MRMQNKIPLTYIIMPQRGLLH